MVVLSRTVARKHNGETAKIFNDLVYVLQDSDLIVLYAPVGTCGEDRRKNINWNMHYASYHVFVKNEHYNFLIVEKENGNEYYCNLASLPVIEEDAVHYIDYDIDVVLSPDGDVTVHDRDEFAERMVQWNYPTDLVAVLRQKQTTIEHDLRDRSGYFSNSFYRYLAALLVCLPDPVSE